MVIRLTTLNNSTLRSRSSLTSPNLDIWASPICLFTYASDYSGLVGFHLSRFLGAKINIIMITSKKIVNLLWFIKVISI